MADILRTLADISTEYTVFEKDQVLTHAQLNSMAEFADDQTRLTRVNLLGVGIVCGLRLSIQGSNITVTKGTGVTTDGDLAHLEADTVYDKFKPYGEGAPKYTPFYVNNALIPLFELIASGTNDSAAVSLSQFESQTGNAFSNMVAVLFMESYIKDEDICSGTDCDNLGQKLIHTLKVLLTDKASATSLRTAIATPGQIFGSLKEIVADRPLLPSNLTTPNQFADIYRNACNAIHGKLMSELPKLYPNCADFLSNTFSADPTGQWVAKLQSIQAGFAGSSVGIQYYYDLLKDIVSTWNEFRDLLFGEFTWCCPNITSFPKHLLLGESISSATSSQNRTPFYPSPIVSRTAHALSHAPFLARKLNTLINTFKVPASGTGAIRITPSRFEDSALEERAIPYYYEVNTTHPVHEHWSYALSQRGMAAYNYSYNFAAYGAQGAAASPLTAQIGRFPFFRIEGHLGQSVSAVVSSIENEIKAKNLPFLVRSVLLGTDKTKVVKKPGTRYTDLHKFHYILRQDLSSQLDEAVQFSGAFKQEIDAAVLRKDVDLTATGTNAQVVANEKHSTILSKGSAAKGKMNLTFSQFQKDTSWKTEVADVLQAGAQFKSQVGDFVKTDFATPIDSIISNTHVQWLDWVGEVIKSTEESKDEKLLFTKFMTDHPGLEHFAGVNRGGTFVLVYDQNNTVVGDLMLPYLCCEETEEEPSEPPLQKSSVRPDYVVTKGLKVGPSLDRFVKTNLVAYKTEQDRIWTEKFDFYGKSLDWVGTVVAGTKTGTITPGVTFSDPALNLTMEEIRVKEERLTLTREKLLQPEISLEEQQRLQLEARTAEGELAKSLEGAAVYLSKSGADVSTNQEGYRALVKVSDSMQKITTEDTQNQLRTDLQTVSNTTENARLKSVLNNMLRR